MCYMVGTEVCTFINFVSFPIGRGWDGSNCVQDERWNPPILVREGLCKVDITTCESPSKTKWSRWRDDVIETANLAARASP
jgi:hypothetical protein